jgi:hypothetical protein
MTLRPEVQCAVVLLAFVLGVIVGGSVADEGSSGWPKTVLAIVVIVATFGLLAAFLACTMDLFWGRGFTTT